MERALRTLTLAVSMLPESFRTWARSDEVNVSKKHSDDELVVEEETEDLEANVDFDIAAYPSDLTLSVIQEMWEAEDIYIPDYQRNYVWSIRQASTLIESFLLGLPVPQVFFYVDEDNKNQVIDGQQRILSVVFYLSGYFGSENIHGKKQVFRLTGLNEQSPFFKKTFSDLSDSYQRKLRSAVLRAINIRQLNPKGEATSVYHIFERLNTGGTPLKPQEIRNCVFRGEFISILRDLNKDENWRKVLGKATFDKHQKDIELLLRIYGLTYHYDDYKKPMKEFLSKVMLKEKKGDSASAKNFVKLFPVVMEGLIGAVGPKPFHIRGPLNSSALDAVAATLIAHEEVPEDIAERYLELKKNEEFIATIQYSTSDSSVLEKRFAIVKRILLG